MILAIGYWLFIVATLVDIPLIVLKLCGILSLAWWILIAMPFGVAIVGALALGLLYLLIRIFVGFIIP